jgi:hypothetical protein
MSVLNPLFFADWTIARIFSGAVSVVRTTHNARTSAGFPAGVVARRLSWADTNAARKMKANTTQLTLRIRSINSSKLQVES